MNPSASNLELFATDSPTPESDISAESRCTAVELNQYFFPDWAAVELYDAHFGHLSAGDLLCELACGDGAMLGAVPASVSAFGVEIDPVMAQRAATRTGRKVIVGDFCTVDLPRGITAFFSNPPFASPFVERVLERADEELSEGCHCGLVLPAYMFQTSGTVVRWSRKWTIQQEALPRDIFPAGRIAGREGAGSKNLLSKPLAFTLFTKDRRPHLIGFRLYRETREIRDLPESTQRILVNSGTQSRSVWFAAVRRVVESCGGRANLDTIYERMSGNRPTDAAFWKEKVRQTLARYFNRVDEATYAIAA